MAFAVGGIGYSRDMSAEDPQAAPAENDTDPAAIEAFIGRWEKSGGSEIANFQPFAKELCALLVLLSGMAPCPSYPEVSRAARDAVLRSRGNG